MYNTGVSNITLVSVHQSWRFSLNPSGSSRWSSHLVGFITTHLGNPFVHVRKLVFERLLELLPRKPHWVSLLPIREAVIENLTYVCNELFVAGILLAIHLGLDRGKVHWSFDLLEVVRHAILHGFDSVSKRADESGPESYFQVSDRLQRRQR